MPGLRGRNLRSEKNERRRFGMRETVFSHIYRKYKASPEYPWENDDKDAVFRHSDNRKWFALVMEVKGEKLGLSGDKYVDAINLKIDDRMFHDVLTQRPGIFPAYHMNKNHWISILLNDSVPDAQIFPLLELSYDSVAPKRRKKHPQPSEE